MKDPLPVPDQLEKQLAKCKTVRDADAYIKSRDKTKEVRRNINIAAAGLREIAAGRWIGGGPGGCYFARRRGGRSTRGAARRRRGRAAGEMRG